MSQSSTAERIKRKLRSTDKPAMSAADLADELNVSVNTINNNVESLIEKDTVETTQIGNASAYYIESSDLPSHQKPDHTCNRCGREIREFEDFAKLELDVYFNQGGGIGDETADFHVLCRFCYSDVVPWLFGDDGAMGEYPRVHYWDIPEDQLSEARDNPEIQTHPGEPSSGMEEYIIRGYEIFEELVDDRDERVSEDEYRERLKEEFSPREAEEAFQWMKSGGYFYRDIVYHQLLPAK